MNRLKTTLVLLTILFAAAAGADSPKLQNEQFLNLWPEKAPFATGNSPEDTPALQVFLPESHNARPTGASIVVCPGGGYAVRANHEGPDVGRWFAQNGVTAFVLRYRLGSKGYHHPTQLTDAARAIRFVRHHAKSASWHLDPARVGILGFSAGGHLASTVSTHWDAGDTNAPDPIDRQSSRPDLQILIYPVITMGPTGHAGSRNNLLGKDKASDPALIELLSNEKHVNERTPPAFLVHTLEDKGVPVSNSDNYAAALNKYNVPLEYVRTEKGQHGFGLKDFWTKPCIEWLRKMKF